MITQTKNTDKFIQAVSDFKFEGVMKADWLNDFRRDSISRFHELGLPTVKNEEWKYTNLSDLAKNRFSLSTTPNLKEVTDLQQYLNSDEVNLVFVNGIFSDELSNLQEVPGVTIRNLSEAVLDDQLNIQGFFSQYSTKDAQSFVALNNAFVNAGAFVQINDSIQCKDLIHIVHATSGDQKDAITFPRSLIALGKSAEAKILESHISFSDVRYCVNAVSDIFMAENSHLTYCKSQAESNHAFHINGTRIWQKKDSHLNSFTCTIGGQLTRNNLDIIIDGEGAHSTLNGLYLLSEKQLVDNHTSVDHRPPNCTSSQLYKGILHDAAHAVFNGKIFVKPEAQLTNSYQLNKNLLLGKDCHVDTKPQLEIFADDVKCTHGATIGPLNEEEIFYLQTRCISRDDAIKMLARGFVDDTLNTIECESIQTKLNSLLSRTKI